MNEGLGELRVSKTLFYLTATDQSGMREAFRLCNGDEERKQI